MGTVVQFPGPLPAFLLAEALDNNGRGLITKWLSLFHEARAKLRVRVRNLRRVPRAEWNKGQFRYLEGGLSEIKWAAEKKEFRVVGFDLGGYFVCVVGCFHKQGVYNPHDWLNTAKRIKGEVERGERRTRIFEP